MPMMKRKNRMFEHMEKQGKMPKMSFGGRIEAKEDYEMDNDLSSSHHSAHDMSEPRDEEDMPYIPDDMDPPNHYADGGMVSEENYDYEEGHASEYDSAGEPHTEHEKEDEHPMEYMSKGGRMRKMAKGGMMNRSGFIKSLRRAG